MQVFFQLECFNLNRFPVLFIINTLFVATFQHMEYKSSSTSRLNVIIFILNDDEYIFFRMLYPHSSPPFLCVILLIWQNHFFHDVVSLSSTYEFWFYSRLFRFSSTLHVVRKYGIRSIKIKTEEELQNRVYVRYQSQQSPLIVWKYLNLYRI